MVRSVLALALVACAVGEIGEPVSRRAGGGAAGPIDCEAAGDPDPGALAPPRRLTRAELVATIDRLAGEPVAGVSSILPVDPLDHGLSNQVDVLGVSPLHAQAFRDVAALVARTVVSSPESRARVIGCDLDARERRACLVQLASAFGRRAFRRPLEDAELERLVALGEAVQAEVAAGATDPLERYADAATIVEAILQSPYFLVRLEIGVPVDGRPDVRALTGYEVATRLSFFLWGEGPDDDLLDAAAEGRLDDADGVEEEARRRLDDDRTRAAFRRFFGEWFQLDALATRRFDPALFPEFDATLAASMRREIEALVEEHAWADDGRSFLDVYTAPHGYADTALAALYGVEPPAGGALGRVALPPDERAGLLSTAGVLALSSKEHATNPTGRGLYVRSWVLCDDVPPPPPDVPLTAPEPGESSADTLNRHADDPVCAGCHERLDPIGLGLEMYDALGALRPDFDVAELRDRRTYVAGLASPDFLGGPELGRLVAGSTLARDCVVQHLSRWALGRRMAEDDRCEQERLAAAFDASGGSFRELVIQVVRSDAFRTLRVPADGACE